MGDGRCELDHDPTRARNRTNAAYGTLLGTTETFQLITKDCNPEVPDLFGRDDTG